MRVLVAPAGLGGALTAAQAARLVAEGWRAVAADDHLTLRPLSAGGPGLLDAVTAAVSATTSARTVTAPTSAGEVPAALVHDEQRRTVYVDGGSAVGAHLVLEAQRPAVLRDGTSSGLGELLLAALELAPARVVVGLPARAAVHDAGVGMLSVLAGVPRTAPGASAEAAPEHPLYSGAAALGRLRADHLDLLARAVERLRGIDTVVAAEDETPLLGLHGAGARLRDELGAVPAQEIDRAVGHAAGLLERAPWAGVVDRLGAGPTVPVVPGPGESPNRRAARAPGSGAGGGAAFALSLLGARVLPGPDVVAAVVGLDDAVAAADLVVTGQEVLAGEDLGGSVVAAVARSALAAGTPVIVLAQEVRTSRRELAGTGITAAYAVREERRSGPRATPPRDPAVALRERAVRVARTWAVRSDPGP